MAILDVLSLDLEGTLISNAVSVFPRAGLRDFLLACRTLCPRVVIFTAVPEPRFRDVARVLVQEEVAPEWFAALEYVVWQGSKKDLTCISGADPARALLVDDNEAYVLPEQRDRWIPVRPFESPYDPDRELERVLVEIRSRIV